MHRQESESRLYVCDGAHNSDDSKRDESKRRQGIVRRKSQRKEGKRLDCRPERHTDVQRTSEEKSR